MCGPEGVGRRLVNLALREFCSPKSHSLHILPRDHISTASIWSLSRRVQWYTVGYMLPTLRVQLMLLYKCQSGPNLHFTLTTETAARPGSFFTLSKKQRCDRSILLHFTRPALLSYYLCFRAARKKRQINKKQRFLGFEQWTLPTHHTLVNGSN